MSRRTISIVLLLFFNIMLASFFDSKSGNSNDYRIGVYMPPDIDSGLMLGYSYNKTVDKNVSVGGNIDLFWSSYTKGSTIAQEGSQAGEIITQKVSLDYSTFYFPTMATARIIFPIEIGSFKVFSGLGAGLNFLINKEINYNTKEEDFRFFNGFGWKLRAGLFYSLGKKSDLSIELFYNSAVLSSNSSETDDGFPIYDEIDMSGVGMVGTLILY